MGVNLSNELLVKGPLLEAELPALVQLPEEGAVVVGEAQAVTLVPSRVRSFDLEGWIARTQARRYYTAPSKYTLTCTYLVKQ